MMMMYVNCWSHKIDYTGIYLAAYLCNGCNIGKKDLPDMYAKNPRVAGLKDEGIHIRQITNAHVTNIM